MKCRPHSRCFFHCLCKICQNHLDQTMYASCDLNRSYFQMLNLLNCLLCTCIHKQSHRLQHYFQDNSSILLFHQSKCNWFSHLKKCKHQTWLHLIHLYKQLSHHRCFQLFHLLLPLNLCQNFCQNYYQKHLLGFCKSKFLHLCLLLRLFHQRCRNLRFFHF